MTAVQASVCISAKISKIQAGFYSLGNCEIRWAFILAIIATFDGFILGESSLQFARFGLIVHLFDNFSSRDNLSR